MLFHSQEFLFIFLPVVFIGTFILNNIGNTLALYFLGISSLIFYAFGEVSEVGLAGFEWHHLCLILFSIGFNYFIGRQIGRNSERKKILIKAGVTINLLVLGVFKYSDLIVSTALGISGKEFETLGIELPLAISFFTFQQIAFLVDLGKGNLGLPNFRHYLVFVTFFPQLIAGPIVKCQSIVPQLQEGNLTKVSGNLFWAGICLFSIGIAKKAYLADGIRPLADAAFSAASEGKILSFAEAWVGAMAFGFQVYFDFSAYSDIAIGIGLMFGLQLPLNFNSPYKARSIIEFWRRWHITLSEFLRNYLYIPLGGNKWGIPRTFINILVVMLLGGIWHGASWNFMVWGGIHGLLIGSNHLLRGRKQPVEKKPNALINSLKCVSTFCLVTIAWVPFRSQGFEQSLSMVKSMIGLNGLDLPRALPEIAPWVRNSGALPLEILRQELLPVLGILALIVWFAPNSQNMVGFDPTSPTTQPRMPGLRVLILAGALLFLGLKSSFEIITFDYLYFRF